MLSDADFDAHSTALVSGWVTGRVALKCGGAAVAVGLDRNDEGRARITLAGIPARLGADAAEWSIEASILLDEAYGVPVLWFTASNGSGEVPAHEGVISWVQANAPTGSLAVTVAAGDTRNGLLEAAADGGCAVAASPDVAATAPAARAAAASASAGPAGAMVSCEWHPWTRVPAYCIHACRTAACLDEMLAAAAASDASATAAALLATAAADTAASPPAGTSPPLQYMVAWCSLYLPLVGVTVEVRP